MVKTQPWIEAGMRDAQRQRLAGLAIVLSAGLLLAATPLACGPSSEPAPRAFPVKGVVRHKGGQPLEGGVIEFRLVESPTFMMTSAIESDGTFELHTLFGNQKLPGGAAGACRVTVYQISQTGELIPRTLLRPGQPLMIEETANEFDLEID
jgi:hypothetical protein